MDELLKQVMGKAALDEEKAQQAIDAVVEYLQDKLPEPIASQLEGIIDGTIEKAGGAGGIMDMIMGMFGGGKK